MARFTSLLACSALVNEEEEETGPDWIGFIAQAGGGLIAGALVAIGFVSPGRMLPPMAHGFLFGGACSLLGAGLGGYWGDRLWFSRTSIQGDLPRRHPATTAICIALIVAGGALAAASVLLDPAG